MKKEYHYTYFVGGCCTGRNEFYRLLRQAIKIYPDDGRPPYINQSNYRCTCNSLKQGLEQVVGWQTFGIYRKALPPLVTMKEYQFASSARKKHFLETTLGYKIDSLEDFPSGVRSPTEYVSRFRHHHNGYSTAHIFEVEDKLIVMLENFSTGELEEIQPGKPVD